MMISLSSKARKMSCSAACNSVQAGHESNCARKSKNSDSPPSRSFRLRAENFRRPIGYLSFARTPSISCFRKARRVWLLTLPIEPILSKKALILVIGRIEHNYHVVSAHRPEFLDDLHAHFLGHAYRGVAAFDGILNVANALLGKLNKANIHCHKSFLSFEVSVERLWRSPPVCKSNVPAVQCHPRVLFGSHAGLYTEFVRWIRSVISRF